MIPAKYKFSALAISTLLAVLILTATSPALKAQPENWDIRNYTTKDGLSSNHVNCIARDSRGFMWFGASNGLNRFDGYNFTTLMLPSGEAHPHLCFPILFTPGCMWQWTIKQ